MTDNMGESSFMLAAAKNIKDLQKAVAELRAVDHRIDICFEPIVRCRQLLLVSTVVSAVGTVMRVVHRIGPNKGKGGQ